MRLLIVSTSKIHGSGYMEYLHEEVADFFSGCTEILFVPYARPGGISWDGYTAHVRTAFQKIGFDVKGLHEYPDPKAALQKAQGIFTGGGNTFVLLKTLYDLGLMETLRAVVRSGAARYMGSSAGSNLTGQSIGTTNDMPIVYPPSFEALGLVPVNINPHYMDPQPDSTHMGETREQRIGEFHHFNQQSVWGLREGSWLRVEGPATTLKGPYTARVFRPGQPPLEVAPGPVNLV